MLSVHFNGDVVHCPDSAANYEKRLIEYDETGRCRYGQREIYCPAYLKYYHSINRAISGGNIARCTLCDRARKQLDLWSSSIKPIKIDKSFDIKPLILYEKHPCPLRQSVIARGRKKKQYEITPKVYRKMASAGHYLIKTSRNKAVFFTLTFPKFKKNVTDKEVNVYFSRFMENLRKTYNCAGYVACRENGALHGRVHFHILCTIPFVPFVALNRVWCNTISDICNFSANALTTNRRRSIVTNPVAAIRYFCKYFSKSKGQKSDSRIVFISNNILRCNLAVRDDIQNLLSEFRESVYAYPAGDYCTVFQVRGDSDFLRLLNNIIYPLFECDVGKCSLDCILD